MIAPSPITIDFSSLLGDAFIQNLPKGRGFEHLEPLISFCKEWYGNASTFAFSTSGTTGQAKNLVASKAQIISSVEATAHYFNIQKGDSVFICLNMHYTGGKMMLARAIHLGLKAIIAPPSNFPFSNFAYKNNKLTALVPSQIHTLLAHSEASAILKQFDNILLGGVAVDKNLATKCKSVEGPTIYETFGMTETLSHIALKKLNGDQANDLFELLPNIEIATTNDNCLKIKGKVTNDAWLETKDIVEIVDPGKFRWKGRADNVINSGGIKIYPEELEKQIAPVMEEFAFPSYYFSHQTDEKLGNKLILVVEGTTIPKEEIFLKLRTILAPYYLPKTIMGVSQLARTESGKIKRNLLF